MGARRPLGATALLVLAGVAVAPACGGDDPPVGLPDCAAALPLPEGVEVVEVTAEPRPENPTCAVTLASDAGVDEVVGSWRAALDEDGIDHTAQHQPGVQGVIRLDGPVCGSILVFAAGTERVTEAVAPERTPALASILECPGG